MFATRAISRAHIDRSAQYVRQRRELIDKPVVEHAQIRLPVFDKSDTRNYADLLRREIDLAVLIEAADAAVAKNDIATEADWPDGLERQLIGRNLSQERSKWMRS